MKPVPEQLDAAAYPHRMKVQTRYADMVGGNHLNNVAIGRFYEEGRLALRRMQPPLAEGDKLLLAEVCIQYLHEGFYPGELTVCTGVLKVGRTSCVYGGALFQNGVCIGTSQVTEVFADADGPAPLSDRQRAFLQEYVIRARVLEDA
jgi:acyl-CoA thioester hydrolase